MQNLIVVPRYCLTNNVDYSYNFPLGLGYISSVLKQKGYAVDCINLNHFNGTIKEILSKALNEKNYDLVCSGHTGIGYAVIEKIVNTCRNHPSKPKVILGGPLITSEPELMIKSLKPDVAVIGEGELTIVKLFDALEKGRDLKKIDGIGYEENGKLIITKPREVIKDLDSLPFPDFEGFDFFTYLNNLGSQAVYGLSDAPREYPILASRGCPFQCTFCYHSLGEKYRQRSIDNVIKELEWAIEKYEINLINIYDDLFSIDKVRLYNFCSRLKGLITKYGQNIKWTCNLSVAHVDKEMLLTLKNSGCEVVCFGLESYNQDVLNSMKKPITPKQIDNALRLAREVGICVQGNFIFGDIAETKETAQATLDYWKKNSKGQILIGFIQPYPGSRIYKHCIEKGLIKDKLDFIKNHMHHTNWINMTDKMSDEEILWLKKEILNARKEYAKYVTPLQVRKVAKEKYNIAVRCPYCEELMEYKNWGIKNILYHRGIRICKHCGLRFFIVSPLYKFTVNYYQKLDFFRRTYLSLRDKILKERM